jgi:hypothetical protein
MELLLLWVAIVLPMVITIVELTDIEEGSTTCKIKWAMLTTAIMSIPFLIALL